MKPSAVAAISATILAFAAPAWADAQGSAALSDLRIELVDLDLADGIAAGLAPIDASSETRASLFDLATGLPTAEDLHATIHALGPLASALGTGMPTYASATLGDALSTSPIALWAQAGTDASQTLASAFAQLSSTYALSAHTQLVFEGVGTLSTSARIDPASGLQEASSGAISAEILTANGGNGFVWTDLGRPFRLTYDNASADPLELTLLASVGVSALVYPAPAVAEPACETLLAAGLGILALARRRQIVRWNP